MCTGRCSKPSIHVGGWVTVGNFKIKVGNTGEKLKQGLKDLEKGESRWFGLHWSEMTAASPWKTSCALLGSCQNYREGQE